MYVNSFAQRDTISPQFQSRAFFQASFNLAPMMFEPHFNFANLSDKVGDLQSSFTSIKRSVDAFPDHSDSKELFKVLKQHFAML